MASIPPKFIVPQLASPSPRGPLGGNFLLRISQEMMKAPEENVNLRIEYPRVQNQHIGYYPKIQINYNFIVKTNYKSVDLLYAVKFYHVTLTNNAVFYYRPKYSTLCMFLSA